MHAIVLHGSPHKEGSSNTLVSRFLEGLQSFQTDSKQDSYEISHFYLNELKIEYCQGCLYCATSENHLCKIQDDMQQIYTDFKKADLVVIATPMYWGYMTGQMKVTFDRMEALAWQGLHGKRIVVIITYHHHYETTISFFERIAPFFKLKMHYLICCTNDPETGKDMDVKSLAITKFPHKLKEAFELGIKISSS
jgi:multimeric flavodoxin WrbA